MNEPSNTPPDGDFASYVERLAAQDRKPVRESRQAEPGFKVDQHPLVERFALFYQLATGVPKGHWGNVAADLQGVPVLKHLAWLVAAAMLVNFASDVPGLITLSVTIMIVCFYAVWVAYKMLQNRQQRSPNDVRHLPTLQLRNRSNRN